MVPLFSKEKRFLKNKGVCLIDWPSVPSRCEEFFFLRRESALLVAFRHFFQTENGDGIYRAKSRFYS